MALARPSHRSPGMNRLEEWISDFVFDTCLIAGQVIDHNSMPDRLSFATAMKLDEQMQSISVSAPPNWWDLDGFMPQEEQEVDSLRDKLLIQFFFLHVRMYLHLPFLAAATPTEQLLVSSNLCYTIAERMMRCYIILRRPMKNGNFLLDCKTTDFVGFTATAVLLVARCRKAAFNMISVEELTSSWALSQEAKDIFRDLNHSNSCNVTRQCYLSLCQMLNPIKDERIPIPYFGIAVMNPPHTAYREAGSDALSTPAPEIDANILSVGFEFKKTCPAPQLGSPSLQGLANCWGADTSLLDINSFQWDIDEDWALFT